MKNFLSLGTAQFAQNYGILGANKFVEQQTIDALLKYASSNNFNHIDTAVSYGETEKKIGEFFKYSGCSQIPIVTKVPSLPQQYYNQNLRDIKNWLKETIGLSLKTLFPAKIDTILLHNWSDINILSGDYFEVLKEVSKSFGVFKIGVSVYDVIEIKQVLKRNDLHHLQVPFNIIDSRILNSKSCMKLIQSTNCEIHVRSIFLQGLLLSDGKKWPQNNKGGFKILDRIDQCARDLNKRDRLDLIFSYLMSQKWISSAIIGVQNESQLHSLVCKCEQSVELKREETAYLHKVFGKPSNILLDPRKWTHG